MNVMLNRGYGMLPDDDPCDGGEVDKKEGDPAHSFGKDRAAPIESYGAVYAVRHKPAGDEPRKSFANYVYDVFLGDAQVGEILHDFRGDDHQARTTGDWQGCTRSVMAGGGPEPLYLTPEGVALFDRLLGRK